MSINFNIKGLIDTKNFPNFRLIVNLPQNIINNYYNIALRLNQLHNTCFFSNIDLACDSPQNCPRLVFISSFQFSEQYQTQDQLNLLIQKYSTDKEIGNILNYLNQNPILIKSYLKIVEHPTFNEIYDVCTSQEERNKGYTSNLFYYYRLTYGNKIGWIGIKLENNFTSQEDYQRAFQKYITNTNFKVRNNRIRQMIERGIEVPKEEQDKTYRNLTKLFKLSEKYWKHLAELYINNGFTEILITDKTPSGNLGPSNWFLSLFMVPNYSVTVDGNVVIERNEQGKWTLKTINNYNLIFKSNVQTFFNKIYKEYEDEEVSGSLFVEEIEFDGQGNSFFSLKSQKDVFLGFESDFAFQTMTDTTRFNWHLHPSQAYVHYQKPTGEPSAGDLIHQLSNIKKLNFFEVIFSKEGFYFYKVSPPIQTLFLNLDTNDKYQSFKNYFSELILQINNKVGAITGNVSERIQAYLNLINNINIKEVMPLDYYERLNRILSPTEQNLFKIIYQSNIKIFEVVHIPEFETLNENIKQVYINYSNLYEFIVYIKQLLHQNYYEEYEYEDISQEIIDEAKGGFLKNYFNFEAEEEILNDVIYLSQWKKVNNFQEQILKVGEGTDILSLIFSNRRKIYSYFKIENFINYSPIETFAPNTL